MTKKRFSIVEDKYGDIWIKEEGASIYIGNLSEPNVKIITYWLNELNDEVKSQSLVIKGYQDRNDELFEENKSLKQQLKSEHQMLDNAILLERTRMGQNSLKQYKEAIQ